MSNKAKGNNVLDEYQVIIVGVQMYIRSVCIGVSRLQHEVKDVTVARVCKDNSVAKLQIYQLINRLVPYLPFLQPLGVLYFSLTIKSFLSVQIHIFSRQLLSKKL